MHRVNRSLLIPYSRARMYELVRDVASYPKFLPWCAGTQVWPQEVPDVVQARVEIAYRGVRSHFTTRNEHQQPNSIDLRLIDGPFRTLEGRWSFEALGEDACKVHLRLEYRFAGGLLGHLISPVFDHVAGSLIDAFALRAHALYGESEAGAGRA